MANLTDQDLVTARADYEDLLATVRAKEGHLSTRSVSGGRATKALEELGRTQIKFGHPRDTLIRLTPKLFKSTGFELDALQKKKMQSENFYYLTMVISMVPGDAVKFDQIKCELEFKKSGPDAAIIHSMFPAPEWKEILKWGGRLDLGLDANMSWNMAAGLDTPEQLKKFAQLPAELKAKVTNKNKYKGFIVIPAFSYSLGRADIAATGLGNTFGYWDIQKPELKQTQTAKFGLIFKVPKTIRTVTLVGKAVAHTSSNWLFANLKTLINSLSPNQQEHVAHGWPLGDFQPWKLTLPK